MSSKCQVVVACVACVLAACSVVFIDVSNGIFNLVNRRRRRRRRRRRQRCGRSMTHEGGDREGEGKGEGGEITK